MIESLVAGTLTTMPDPVLFASDPLYRVYFDGNDGPDNERFGLWLDRSIEDLAKIPGGPKDGLLIIIYQIGEIEMEARLEWDATWQAWTARPVSGTVRDNHETWD